MVPLYIFFGSENCLNPTIGLLFSTLIMFFMHEWTVGTLKFDIASPVVDEDLEKLEQQKECTCIDYWTADSKALFKLKTRLHPH